MTEFPNQTAIIVQARMGSTRLPGKVMLDLCGKPVLFRILERLKTVAGAALIVATSVDSIDDIIQETCIESNVPVLRGHPTNVLNRYVKAAEQYHLQHVVRVTADCPLIDPRIIDQMLENYRDSAFDYYSNVRTRTFPRGLDCEIFPAELLRRAFAECIESDAPEHVVFSYVERCKANLRIGHFESRIGNYSHLRWTLDEKADYDLIRTIYESLYPGKKLFLYEDVVELYKRKPELKDMNAQVRQKSI